MNQNQPSSMRYAWRRAVNRDARLTEADVRVLFELESWTNSDGTNAYPGAKRIAEVLPSPKDRSKNLSVKTVERVLEKARELGYIERTAKARRVGSRRLSDVYRLVLPPAEDAGLTDIQASVNSDEGLTDIQMSVSVSSDRHAIDRHGRGDWPTSGCLTTSPYNTSQENPPTPHGEETPDRVDVDVDVDVDDDGWWERVQYSAHDDRKAAAARALELYRSTAPDDHGGDLRESTGLAAIEARLGSSLSEDERATAMDELRRGSPVEAIVGDITLDRAFADAEA
ncbi:hypothetical protein ACFW9U_17380 [Rhodococcus aetherivorans]|uniref:hypothetical protein n=1 Tax=Rhodococcus aetherivorans TaxID=191292 RepID=UPI00366D0DC7